MATTEDSVRFNRGTVTYAHTDSTGQQRVDMAAPSDLEKALVAAVRTMRRVRLGLPGHVDLEALGVQVIEAAMREQHTEVLCSAQDPANPTTEEHRWAQSIAGAVASRFQRSARRVMRSLKGEAPAPVVDTTRDDNGCPAWCVHYGTGVEGDWHESKPIAFHGPGDFYLQDPEPLEVLWAAISEVPQDAVDDGEKPGTYIFMDTIGDGMGARLNVAETDDIIRRLSHYVLRLKAMRDQLAALKAAQD